MSELNLIAARYVNALFSLAGEQKQHDAVKKDMLALQEAFAGSDALRKFLVNPVMEREQSAQVIAAVLDAMKASDLTKKFFALLAHERRLAIAPAAAQKYLEMLAESRNELSVQLTSAKALDKKQVDAIADSLSKSTGKKVTVNTSENASLIGGLQVRVGSKLLDHSIAGKLARMRLALTKAA